MLTGNPCGGLSSNWSSMIDTESVSSNLAAISPRLGSREAVMSAVRQTYPSIQLIVFDNVVRTQALLEEGGYDESMPFEDYSLAFSFAHKGRRIVHNGELYTLWRRHANNSPEYPSFARRQFKGYFRMLAGERKSEAIRLLRTEPIAWSWEDVGIGMLKLALPPGLLRRLRTRFRDVIDDNPRSHQ